MKAKLKKIIITLEIIFFICIILQLIISIGTHETIREINSVSKNDYKLIEKDYSVKIPNDAVITQMYENNLFFSETLNVILVMPEDQEQKFANSIKIHSVKFGDGTPELNSKFDNLPLDKDMLINTNNQKIVFKCYKAEAGEFKVEMQKVGPFSKELSKLLSKVKYHDIGPGDRGKIVNFQN